MKERNLTFFECISRSLQNGITGLVVHDSLLFYLMRIVFSNAEYDHFQAFCQAIIQNDTHHLELNPQLIHNNAMKQWVYRFSKVERSVAKTPDVWFQDYPKLLKGAMLRFFVYHRDYIHKPHRIYCKYVFAHLAAEFYHQAIGISEKKRIRWFYPLGALDYFHSIVIQPEKEIGSFTLLDSSAPPLLLREMSEEEEEGEELPPRFVLRLSQPIKGGKSWLNEQVGTFEGEDKVYICTFEPNNETLSEDIYQIYPGDRNRCFFDLGFYEMMVVYCIIAENRAGICATHKHNEQYPFFKLLPGTQQVVVVVARDLAQSAEILNRQTKYLL